MTKLKSKHKNIKVTKLSLRNVVKVRKHQFEVAERRAKALHTAFDALKRRYNEMGPRVQEAWRKAELSYENLRHAEERLRRHE